MDVTNPGLVNVADQGDGLTVVDQPVTTGPSQNAGATVQGGTYSPQSPNTTDTTENTVVDQQYGTGDPVNVFAS